jgi:hypothetical protein
VRNNDVCCMTLGWGPISGRGDLFWFPLASKSGSGSAQLCIQWVLQSPPPHRKVAALTTHLQLLFRLSILMLLDNDRLCGLVIRLPGYRPRGLGFDSRRYQIFWVAVGLEWCALSPREDKCGATWKKISGSGLENSDQGPWGSAALTTRHLSICKSWH